MLGFDKCFNSDVHQERDWDKETDWHQSRGRGQLGRPSHIQGQRKPYWCCCCYHVTIVAIVEEMLSYSNRLRSTHCRKFHYLKLCRAIYFVRTTQYRGSYCVFSIIILSIGGYIFVYNKSKYNKKTSKKGVPAYFSPLPRRKTINYIWKGNDF